MRFADTPEVQVETTIAAPPSAVWPLVTDIQLPATFSPEFQGAEWLDGADGPAPGARFHGRNRNDAIGEWQVTCTVTDFEPERTYGWTVGDLDEPMARWRFDLEPTDDGGTLLRQWARLGPGQSGVTMMIERYPEKEERIVEGRIDAWRRDMTANVAGIKDLAEAGRRGRGATG
jgi:uncharacterized protein YndB with AHSA1/START domain